MARPDFLVKRLPIALGALALIASAAAADPASFTLPEDGVVLHYQRVLGEIDHPDPGPEVSLHADGLVLIRRPAYQKNPGFWRTTLGADEMRELLTDFVRSGVIDRNDTELRSRRQELIREGAEARTRAGLPRQAYAVGDPDRTVLEISLASYRPPGQVGGESTGAIRRSWNWLDLYGDANRFPEWSELRALARLEARLIELMDSATLEEVQP